MVKLQLLILSNLTGYIHVQTNPKQAYSTAKTVENAESERHRETIYMTHVNARIGLVAIIKTLAPDVNPKRICIKIPATWEGIQACRIAEARGIATLATTMFCMEQAALAAHANCTYIAPYVNELKVHFEKEYVVCSVNMNPQAHSVQLRRREQALRFLPRGPGLLSEPLTPYPALSCVADLNRRSNATRGYSACDSLPHSSARIVNDRCGFGR